MLSDSGSQPIDAYHIRNEAAKEIAVGVPNPGTFLLDRQGVIRAKLFLEGFRDRHTTEALIKAANAIPRSLAPGVNDNEINGTDAGPRLGVLWDVVSTVPFRFLPIYPTLVTI